MQHISYSCFRRIRSSHYREDILSMQFFLKKHWRLHLSAVHTETERTGPAPLLYQIAVVFTRRRYVPLQFLYRIAKWDGTLLKVIRDVPDSFVIASWCVYYAFCYDFTWDVIPLLCFKQFLSLQLDKPFTWSRYASAQFWGRAGTGVYRVNTT